MTFSILENLITIRFSHNLIEIRAELRYISNAGFYCEILGEESKVEKQCHFSNPFEKKVRRGESVKN